LFDGESAMKPVGQGAKSQADPPAVSEFGGAFLADNH
jgi:hypothetical protein